MLFRMLLVSYNAESHRAAEITEKTFSVAWNKRLVWGVRCLVHSRRIEGEHTCMGLYVLQHYDKWLNL